MAELIAAGTTEVASGAFTLGDGQAANIMLKPANVGTTSLPTDCAADIQQQTSDGGWFNIYRLSLFDMTRNVWGPGVFRVVRRAAATSYGVDKS